MKNKKLIVGLAILVVAAAAIAIIGTKSGKQDHMGSMDMSTMSMQDQSSQPAATNTVAIKQYMFTPAKITVKVGTTVTWTNQDAVEHNVVADTKSSDAPDGPLFGQGKTYSYTFKKAGTYDYHCAPHPYMKGTVEVTE